MFYSASSGASYAFAENTANWPVLSRTGKLLSPLVGRQGLYFPTAALSATQVPSGSHRLTSCLLVGLGLSFLIWVLSTHFKHPNRSILLKESQ